MSKRLRLFLSETDQSKEGQELGQSVWLPRIKWTDIALVQFVLVRRWSPSTCSGTNLRFSVEKAFTENGE
jgi:hypothetical protein